MSIHSLFFFLRFISGHHAIWPIIVIRVAKLLWFVHGTAPAGESSIGAKVLSLALMGSGQNHTCPVNHSVKCCAYTKHINHNRRFYECPAGDGFDHIRYWSQIGLILREGWVYTSPETWIDPFRRGTYVPCSCTDSWLVLHLWQVGLPPSPSPWMAHSCLRASWYTTPTKASCKAHLFGRRRPIDPPPLFTQ